jgi:hypothetical protein
MIPGSLSSVSLLELLTFSKSFRLQKLPIFYLPTGDTTKSPGSRSGREGGGLEVEDEKESTMRRPRSLHSQLLVVLSQTDSERVLLPSLVRCVVSLLELSAIAPLSSLC